MDFRGGRFPPKPSLAQYLLSTEGRVEPDVELDLTRSRRVESRDTGI
jgi:hypothetical protein